MGQTLSVYAFWLTHFTPARLRDSINSATISIGSIKKLRRGSAYDLERLTILTNCLYPRPISTIYWQPIMSLTNPEDAASLLEQFVHDGKYRIALNVQT